MRTRFTLMLLLFLWLAAGPATAQIALDRLIVELAPTTGAAADVEVTNRGDETAYVRVDPREVVAPGSAAESRRAAVDPAALGLLAAPGRLVLEPGARRIVRLSRLDGPTDRERVWRVAIRPVTGPTESETNAVQVLVGYGVLVVGRPREPVASVRGERSGRLLELVNDGNSNALLFDGRHCDPGGERCLTLPAQRLYPGNRWTVELRWNTPAHFQIEGPEGVRERRF
jgi:P pilus assembly chaperone PapD